jgi:hypothetical protein
MDDHPDHSAVEAGLTILSLSDPPMTPGRADQGPARPGPAA